MNKLKLILAAALAGTVAVGTSVATVDAVLTADEAPSSNKTYTVQVEDSELTVDTKTLNLSITRGDRVWYSGKRYSEEDGLNNLWVKKLTDAVTVGYRSMNTGNTNEAPMSNLNSKVTFTQKSNGFDAKISCNSISIDFTLQVRLDGNKLKVKVPFSSIVEKSDANKLQYLQIYSFFDSSYSLVDGGAILVPDGCGALIDLSVPTSAKQRYFARIYGDDYGITTPQVSTNAPEKATAPVFALMYGDGGTMVTADSGAEYCEINASVSSITTDYNIAYLNWIYREPYVKYYESSGTSGKNYIAFQEDMNKFDLEQTMTLIDGECGLPEVAKEYRKTVAFKSGATAPSSAGMRLEFLMAENKQGMFGNEVVTMTKAWYAADVAEEVSKYCNNLSVSLLGYTKGGLNGSYPRHFPLDNGPGTKNSYSSLSKRLEKVGAKLSFVTDYAKAYTNASVDNKKLVMNMSNQFVTLNDSRSGSTAKFNLVNPIDAASLLKSDLKTVKKYGAGIDYASVGSFLFSGYKNRNFDRADTAKRYAEMIANTGVTANISKPNSYLWGVCDSYLDMPVSSSGFMIETQSVPFIQMVLSGKVQSYSSPVNLNYTGKELVLRFIDFNVYPSFLLTQKDAIELYGTNSSSLFTSSYTIWKDTVKSVYNEVDGVLSQVAGCTIEDRYDVNGDVSVTTYSNGVSVIVNYSDSDVTVEGTGVGAKSATAVKLA